jgi:PfaB family protein
MPNWNKLAIIGMDILLPGCDGVDEFERAIYDGEQHFPAPEGAGWERTVLAGSLPTGEVDSLTLEDLLLLRVAQRALADAGLTDAAAPTALILINGVDNFHPEGGASVSSLLGMGGGGSISPQRASALLHLAGPTFNLSSESNALAPALEKAQQLLDGSAVQAVVIAAAACPEDPSTYPPVDTPHSLGFDQNIHAFRPGEGAAAVVLARPGGAQKQVYAFCDSLAGDPQSALAAAGVTSAQIGYLEAFACGVDYMDYAEASTLAQAYPKGGELTIALGSIQANFGHLYAAAGIASLVRAALCLHHRILPAVPGWSQPKDAALWQDSAFFVPTASCTWFNDTPAEPRRAAVNYMDPEGNQLHLVLGEDITRVERPSRALEISPLCFLPISAADPADLVPALEALRAELAGGAEAISLSKRRLAEFTPAPFTAILLAHSTGELQKEVEHALKGLPRALEIGADWQTPQGSYFTPRPLRHEGRIAFVFPGGFNSYVGIARDVFRLFPSLHQQARVMSERVGYMMRARSLYPRRLSALTKEEQSAVEAALIADPVSMTASGTALAFLYTAILRDIFSVHPEIMFCYSQGENSMLYASELWVNGEENILQLEASPLFRSRLAGAQNAVRECWGLPLQPEDYQSTEDFYANYLLMATPDVVRPLVEKEEHVYLTHINTPRQVVIGGDKAACQRVIAAVRCTHLRAPFNYALHCPPMRLELKELERLHTRPISAQPQARLFTAATYDEVKYDPESVAKGAAEALSAPLDFPRLVNRVYEEGMRFFLEVGAGSNCAKWVDDTLKERPHLSISVNRQGADDLTSILRLLARLVSHGVQVDLSPLKPKS